MKLSSIAKNFFVRVINTESLRTITVLVFSVILTTTPMLAQDGSVRPSRTEALAAWERGDFDLAYEHYNGLLLLYSRDPLYKYFTGACLVKLERDLPRAVTLLGSAINSSVNVKSVPDDVWFYYGRALQMTGSFTQATEAYDRFAKEAGRKVTAEYGVPDYKDQSDKGQGALDEARRTMSGEKGSESVTPGSESVTPGSKSVTPGSEHRVYRPPTTGQEPEKTDQKVPSEKPAVINTDHKAPSEKPAVVNTDQKAPSEKPAMLKTTDSEERIATRNETIVPVITRDKAPMDYEQALGKAVRLQSSADSLTRIAENAISAIEQTPPGQKEAMEKRATDARIMAAARQAEADSLFMILEEKESAVPEMTVTETVQTPSAHLFSRYELLGSPAYSEKNPVPVDIALPAGLIYTIQIAAFRNPVSPSLFKGLYPVFGRKRPESGATYYFAGIFRRIDDARHVLPEVRGTGFPDAFVIAMMDGTQISMERAQVLGKEWTDKPLPGSGTASSGQRESRDELPVPVETLSFRAEVMRVSKPVKPEVIEKLELLAGTRGLDMVKNSNSETVFLIGNFITFESAGDYVSLLIRNGYGTARVAAYVGTQEIPVEAAIELLNRLQDD